ncbi:unnamed protein product [Periconia digitata]|uniref:Aminoglycoside phosphotransferase domain-containing protein n=1 Tax=Periconia digitata TaxID=1303443 RepID=A0A9W4UIW5_9PLEO|nr:unnamed protein product [Periconia digitata]
MQTEHDQVVVHVQRALSKTTFSCSNLTPLSGGTTSFVFLGNLNYPLPPATGSGTSDTPSKAIVKYAAHHLSCSPEFLINPSRCEFEALMLAALQDGLYVNTHADRLVVSTPRLYHFDQDNHVQVMEYFPNTTTLRDALPSLTDSQATSIGRSVGLWLRSFHDWSSKPEQKRLRDTVERNKDMRALKWKITYEQGTQVLERFPDIVGKRSKEMWDEIKASHESGEEADSDDDFGVTHGDFWSGNVLVTETATPRLHVIDFELSHVSHRAIDAGQFIGDLLETAHFDSSLQLMVIALIKAFTTTYANVGEDIAFRIAMHAGVHMINWWSRGPKQDDNQEGKALLHEALKIVARAWKKDREWMKKNEAFCDLFKD